MPLPLLPLIGAGASLIGSGINALSQSSTNRSQLNFSREMYERQRKDALTDTAFQNEYNSPAATMARLKAAGLNPNLIYGQGTQAAGTSAQTRSASPPGYNPQAPKIDASGVQVALMQMYDLQKTQAETNKIEAMTKLLQEQAGLPTAQKALTHANIGLIGANTERQKFEVEKGKSILPLSLEAMQSQIKKTNADTTYTLDQNERSQLASATSFATAIENILSMRANRAKTYAEKRNLEETLKLLKQDGILKAADIKLRELGINPGDPAWVRLGAQALQSKPMDKLNTYNPIWNLLKYFISNN